MDNIPDEKSPQNPEYPSKIEEILSKKGTGDITDVEVSLIIDHVAEEENLNWGEMEDIHDLYKLGDKASHLLGGIPDCILKPSIDSALKLLLLQLNDGWLRNHVLKLQNLWKAELVNERPHKRDTKAVLESRMIELFEEKEKTRPKKYRNKAMAKHRMGVSAMLAHARNTLCVGGRQREITDNEDGTVEVDGEPLTFESWSRMTGGEAEDIAAVDGHFENKIDLKPSVELVPDEKKKRDLEEGEISDDDFPLKKKKIRRAYDSESEESDDEEYTKNKKKTTRAVEREEQRKSAAINADLMKQRFHTIFKLRSEAINYMSVQQRVQMLNSLRMARNENLYDEGMKAQVELAKFLAQN